MNPYAEYVFELNRHEDVAHAIVVLYNVYRGPVPGTAYLRGTHDRDGVPNRRFANSRLAPFFDYTLKSLSNQGSDNFFVVFMYERRTQFAGTTPRGIAQRAAAGLHVPFALAPIAPIDFTRDYRRAFWRRRQGEEDAIRRYAKGKKRLLITYLDGDDLLHTDYVGTVQAELDAKTECLALPGGFMFSSDTRQIRPWDRLPPRTPPFFTLQYQTKDYLAGRRLYGGPGRHLYVREHLRSRVCAQRLFAQHVHGANDSTAYRMPRMHPDLTGHTRDAALRCFALNP